MELSAFVLLLHIAFVVVTFSLAAVMHAGMFLLRSAQDARETRAWPTVIAAVEPSLAGAALLILVTGAWLMSVEGEHAMSEGWLAASVAALVLGEVAMLSLLPRTRRLRRELRQASPGPLTEQLRRRILDPVVWSVTHGMTGLFLAVLALMVVKPSGAWSTFVLVAGAVVGVATALPFVRRTTGTTGPRLAPHGGDRRGSRAVTRRHADVT